MRESWWRGLVGGLFMLLGLVPTACGGPSSVAHGPRLSDILVQVSYVGGGMSASRLDYLTGRFPAFSLRGDGTLLYAKDGTIYRGRLDEAGIQRLLGLAVN